jgi:hypothetical protein
MGLKQKKMKQYFKIGVTICRLNGYNDVATLWQQKISKPK